MAVTLYTLGNIILIMSPIIIVLFVLTKAAIKTKKASKEHERAFEEDILRNTLHTRHDTDRSETDTDINQ